MALAGAFGLDALIQVLRGVLREIFHVESERGFLKDLDVKVGFICHLREGAVELRGLLRLYRLCI